MKRTLKTIRIDEDDLKVIQDEMDRGVYDTQQELFDAIYNRIIKPQIENSQELETELFEEKTKLEVAMDFAYSEGKYSFFDGQLRKIEELLGGADET